MKRLSFLQAVRTLPALPKWRTALAAAGLALAGSACTLVPPAPPVAVYDFGPAPAARVVGARALRVPPVAVPPWLDSAGLQYRLAYADGLRREVYRDSRWAAPPAALLGWRLQQRLPGAVAGTLVLQLDEFAQVFSAPGQSRGVLRLRARWFAPGAADGGAERLFVVEQPATTPDARGGAQALALAADEAVDQLVDWLALTAR